MTPTLPGFLVPQVRGLKFCILDLMCKLIIWMKENFHLFTFTALSESVIIFYLSLIGTINNNFQVKNCLLRKSIQTIPLALVMNVSLYKQLTCVGYGYTCKLLVLPHVFSLTLLQVFFLWVKVPWLYSFFCLWSKEFLFPVGTSKKNHIVPHNQSSLLCILGNSLQIHTS